MGLWRAVYRNHPFYGILKINRIMPLREKSNATNDISVTCIFNEVQLQVPVVAPGLNWVSTGGGDEI